MLGYGLNRPNPTYAYCWLAWVAAVTPLTNIGSFHALWNDTQNPGAPPMKSRLPMSTPLARRIE
jgi:hypothetical protein